MAEDQNVTGLFAQLARLKTENHVVAEAIINLREAIQKSSALDSKTANLIAIGIAAAIRNEDALAAHIKIARDAGAKQDEVISAIILAIPSSGVPAVLNALSVAWGIYA